MDESELLSHVSKRIAQITQTEREADVQSLHASDLNTHVTDSLSKIAEATTDNSYKAVSVLIARDNTIQAAATEYEPRAKRIHADESSAEKRHVETKYVEQVTCTTVLCHGEETLSLMNSTSPVAYSEKVSAVNEVYSDSLKDHTEADKRFEVDTDEALFFNNKYIAMVEEVSKAGQDEAIPHSPLNVENWLQEHNSRLDDIYFEELQKIQKNVESPFRVIEDEDEDEGWPNLDTEMSAEQEEHTAGDNKDKPLYKGCPITVGAHMMLIMTLALRHGLTGDALQDILTLISLHCISPNYCTESLRKFKQLFGNIKSPLVFHYYCSNCFTLIEKNRKETTICPNSFCQKPLNTSGNLAFFIEIPILTQLQELYKKESFWNSVTTYRFKVKRADGVLGDIYDGTLYREHWDSGLLSDPKNISFIYNTDGIPVFKSSQYSLWPLYLAINELPYSERFHKDNMILAGVWFGPSKPFMLTYLKPFHSAFRQLEADGVFLLNPAGQEIFTRAILLCGTCDLPARCLVCNSVQFNGFHGCIRCKQSGKTVKTEKGGLVHAYPFNGDDPSGPLRTKIGTMRDAEQAVKLKIQVDGIKGPSWLGALHYHDIILGTAVDYMHCALEGVTKLLLKLWFSSSESSAQPFNISDQVEKVDKRLKEIKPPNRISRCPRSIESHRKYWKANELRSFLFFYGAMVLRGVLPDVYYEHFMLFSEAIFTLCLTNVTLAQVAHAERLILHFCIKFEKLYSERYETANVHSLLHMAEDVRNLGPLWTHSTFPFESLNGDILKLFHGTQNIVFQIISAISVNRIIPLLSKSLEPRSPEYRFYCKLKNTSQIQTGQEISTNTFVLGKVHIKELSAKGFEALAKFLKAIPERTSCKFFYRVRIGNGIYHSKGYDKPYCRNSYTIQYEEVLNGKTLRHFGIISENFSIPTTM